MIEFASWTVWKDGMKTDETIVRFCKNPLMNESTRVYRNRVAVVGFMVVVVVVVDGYEDGARQRARWGFIRRRDGLAHFRSGMLLRLGLERVI